MLFFVPRPLPVPSLVLFALLTSVSAKIDKAVELSRCDQDDDSFCLMQSEKSWQNSVRSETIIGTNAMDAGGLAPQVPASLPREEFGLNLVQRLRKITSDKYQAVVTDSAAYLIPIAFACAAIALLFGAYVWYQRAQAEQQNASDAKAFMDPTREKAAGHAGAESNAPAARHGTPLRSRSPPAPFSTTPVASQGSRSNSPEQRRSPRSFVVPPPPIPSAPTVESSVSPVSFTKAYTHTPVAPDFMSSSTEARLGVHHLSLGNVDLHTSLDVTRTTGQPIMRMSIAPNAQQGYSLIMSTAQSGQRLCSIVSPQTNDARTPLHILNSQGREHGYFRCVSVDLYEVVVQGASCFTIQGNSECLRYQVVEEARTVAVAQLNNSDFPGGEHLEFRVLPGADAALIVSIILGITVFSDSQVK